MCHVSTGHGLPFSHPLPPPLLLLLSFATPHRPNFPQGRRRHRPVFVAVISSFATDSQCSRSLSSNLRPRSQDIVSITNVLCWLCVWLWVMGAIDRCATMRCFCRISIPAQVLVSNDSRNRSLAPALIHYLFPNLPYICFTPPSPHYALTTPKYSNEND